MITIGLRQKYLQNTTNFQMKFLKCYYDENRIVPIEAILKHR